MTLRRKLKLQGDAKSAPGRRSKSPGPLPMSRRSKGCRTAGPFARTRSFPPAPHALIGRAAGAFEQAERRLAACATHHFAAAGLVAPASGHHR